MGEVYLGRVAKYKPKIFLEIGVFCGVTARNTCDYLFKYMVKISITLELIYLALINNQKMMR